jgi:heme A synthase
MQTTSAKRLVPLRTFVIIILVLLAFQFELGMAVNLASPPSIPRAGISLNGISNALHQAGAAAVFHASLGVWLVLLSLIVVVLSLRSGTRGAQVFGSLAFLAILLAAANGLLFVLSGFQADGYSHGMATGFILSFGFYFLELYFLKPAPKVDERNGTRTTS